MAELLVVATKLAEAVVTEAVLRISDLLVDEAAALASVRDDVEGLRTELTRIKCFLEDADRKQERDKRVQNWVAEVRDVASEIEDAIETYVFQVNSSLIAVFRLRKLRRKINSVKDKLRGIRESRQTYQIEFSTQEAGGNCSLGNLRRSYPDDEEGDVISLEETERALKAELMKEEDRRCVVSVLGMGGLGKTTLAKRVYNDGDVRRRFDCSAWVFVSQQHAPREIFYEILMQVGFQTQTERRSFEKKKFTKEILEERKNRREILKGLEDRELVLLVKDELREKRYLIVLDDIWSIDAWYSVQSAFPKGKRGSKVVFTTRIKEVAISADPQSSPIEPPLLTAAESWELLRRKVFPRESFDECDSPLEFEQLGKEMVEKCAGLPLAIVVLGGLLRTKKSLDGWKRVWKIVKSHYVGKLKSEQQYGVENILELSFHDLPYYLRPCFLYLGSFPEDSEIHKSKLIRLWIAEGFVPNLRREEAAGETFIEDVAERYLEELIDRCMVQVGEWNHTRKGVKTCRLHDLMRDFCISKSKEEIFSECVVNHDEGDIVVAGPSIPRNATTRPPRIAIHSNKGLISSWAEQVHPRLRSLHVSGINARTLSSQRNTKFILLRVLQLDFLWGKFVYGNLPIGIGNLIHLRYLKVSGASRKFKLPNSMGSLRNLVSLDLRGNRRVLLPSTISGLIRLRHLLLPYNYSRTCFGNFTLTNIETLKGIYARDLIKCTLKNLRVLRIKLECHQEFYALIPLLSSQLVRLRSFAVVLSKYECELPNLKFLSQCQVLSRLHITWPLTPEDFSLLPKTISKLELHKLVLNQDVLAMLEKLPNLRILRMDDDASIYDFEFFVHIREDRKIVFSANGFPKLEILSLEWVSSLENWEVEKGAMPNLKRLDIKRMTNLVMFPDGVKYVTGLKELNISGMKKAFEDRIRVDEDGIEGEDFYKVRHVPAISISDTME